MQSSTLTYGPRSVFLTNSKHWFTTSFFQRWRKVPESDVQRWRKVPESDVQRWRKVPESDARSVSYSKAGKPPRAPRSQHKRPQSSASALPERGIINTRVGQQSTNIHVNYKAWWTDPPPPTRTDPQQEFVCLPAAFLGQRTATAVFGLSHGSGTLDLGATCGRAAFCSPQERTSRADN